MKNTEGCSKNAIDLQEKIKYKCNRCKDMTFILLEDGTAKECGCRAIRIAEEKLKASGVSEEFRKMRFENFDYSNNLETLRAFSTAKNYSKNFEEIRVARNSCLFLGQVGSGKTHLSMAIANNLLDKSIGVIYMPFRDSITKIKQSITDETNYNKEMEIYKNAQVLLIDDLFKGSVTAADINAMFSIINYRYMKKMPIIVSSEKNINQLLDIDEAIASRLIEMSNGYVVEIKGKNLNYRMRGLEKWTS